MILTWLKGKPGEPVIPPFRTHEEDVCGECGEGGKLLICDGDCSLAFHLEW